MGQVDVGQVRKELRAVGVSPFGLRIPEAKAVAAVLNADEHIGGVVYGSYAAGLAWLIATNKRIIFMDRKPFFSSVDELSYDVVSGVKVTKAGPFSSLVLHTKAGDYLIRFANARCTGIFTKYIETRRIGLTGATGGHGQPASSRAPGLTSQNFGNEGMEFLKTHDLAVLSTIDQKGKVHGAVVYYVVDQSDYIYILTKTDTGKGRDIYAHSQVALTVHEAGTMQTAQVQGIAEVETDQAIKDDVMTRIIQPRTYRGEKQLPPITKLHEGTYMVIKINPTTVSFHDYAKMV